MWDGYGRPERANTPLPAPCFPLPVNLVIFFTSTVRNLTAHAVLLYALRTTEYLSVSAHLDRLKAALVDRYTIQREIGSGGMATAYLACDIRRKGRKSCCVARTSQHNSPARTCPTTALCLTSDLHNENVLQGRCEVTRPALHMGICGPA
jgi:hypothetical protein